jgi:hypothetical protein
MATPQPSDAPEAVPPAPPAASASRSARVPAIVGMVGGALGIMGFFLPWYASTTGGSVGVSPQTALYSGWDVTNHYLTGANLPGVTQTSQPTSSAPYLAFMVALPAVMALVALVASGVGVLRGLGAVLASLIGAAGLMGVLSGESFLFTLAILSSPSNSGTGGTSNAGLGVDVMQVGLFAILAGGFMAVAQARHTGA